MFSEFDEPIEDFAPTWPGYEMESQQYMAIGNFNFLVLAVHLILVYWFKDKNLAKGKLQTDIFNLLSKFKIEEFQSLKDQTDNRD